MRPALKASAETVNLSSRIEFIAGMAVLTLLTVGCLVVLRPFLSSILWALVLCFSTWPIYTWVLDKLDGRRTLAPRNARGATRTRATTKVMTVEASVRRPSSLSSTHV